MFSWGDMFTAFVVGSLSTWAFVAIVDRKLKFFLICLGLLVFNVTLFCVKYLA